MVSEHRALLLCQSGAGSVNLILSPEAEHRASSARNRIGVRFCDLGNVRPDGGLAGLAGAQRGDRRR